MFRLPTAFFQALAARARWVALPLAVSTCVLSAAPASAANLAGPISGWEQGIEPSWVTMYEYIPDAVAPNPPILLVVHFCSGNAHGVFQQAQDGGMVALADQYGFIMILPQTTRNCWDVASTESLTHDGGGDTLAMVHQVQYAIANYGANADRVYVTGTSSGAMVTQAMMAVYPDVFKGGVAFAGVPAGCWSVNNLDTQWSSPCAGGEVTHTAQEWGDMARNMYLGYTGFRPRIQLWHGEADSILSLTNHTEAIKQWTNVFGFDITPTSSTREVIDGNNYTREQWQDACGIPVIDAWTQDAGPHGTLANMNGAYSIPFLALDQTDPIDPQAAGCGADGGTTDTSTASTGAGTTTTGAGTTTTGAGTTTTGAGTTTTGGSASGATGSNASGATGSSASGATGASASGATGTSGGPAAELPTRPGCACDLARTERGAGAFAWLGMLALVFGRRRRRSPGADAAAQEISHHS